MSKSPLECAKIKKRVANLDWPHLVEEGHNDQFHGFGNKTEGPKKAPKYSRAISFQRCSRNYSSYMAFLGSLRVISVILDEKK